MKTQKPSDNGKLSPDVLADIAKSQGFPDLYKKLEGHGNYIAYTNWDKVRIYDPNTGKQVGVDYKPRVWEVSPTFIRPEEVVVSHVTRKQFPFSRQAYVKTD